MWIKGLSRKYGIEIKRIRLDNSGENRSLHKECEQNLGVIFEFTAPGTPQQNSVVERKIPTLMGRVRSMLIQAGINQKEKVKFWYSAPVHGHKESSVTGGALFCIFLELALVVCEEPPSAFDDEPRPCPCCVTLTLTLSSAFLFLDSAALFTI